MLVGGWWRKTNRPPPHHLFLDYDKIPREPRLFLERYSTRLLPCISCSVHVSHIPRVHRICLLADVLLIYLALLTDNTCKGRSCTFLELQGDRIQDSTQEELSGGFNGGSADPATEVWCFLLQLLQELRAQEEGAGHVPSRQGSLHPASEASGGQAPPRRAEAPRKGLGRCLGDPQGAYRGGHPHLWQGRCILICPHQLRMQMTTEQITAGSTYALARRCFLICPHQLLMQMTTEQTIAEACMLW